jgi:hypothetical protein
MVLMMHAIIAKKLMPMIIHRATRVRSSIFRFLRIMIGKKVRARSDVEFQAGIVSPVSRVMIKLTSLEEPQIGLNLWRPTATGKTEVPELGKLLTGSQDFSHGTQIDQ